MSDLSMLDAQTKAERRILNSMPVLWSLGSVYELRIIGSGKGVISGYYDNPEAFARDASMWSGKAKGVYWTINPCNPDLLARAKNRLREYTRTDETTSDKDIVRRRYIPVDIDPIRPAGIPATHREHCEALAVQGQVADFMAALGFSEPVEMDSGNGAYLLYPVDLANNDDGRNTVKRCLEALAHRFNNPAARVDVSTYNASRIMRVPGTLNCKGDPTPERPHRLAILTIWPKVTP